jgi:predicted metal-dependent hydrolase
MTLGLIIILVIVILFVYYHLSYRYGHRNTKKVAPCNTCETYNVHREHNDSSAAAGILEEVTKRNKMLIEHLRQKYHKADSSDNMDPTKNNRIDIVPGSELFNLHADDLRKVASKEYLQERIEQLLNNYNSDKIYEISPLNSENVTSYTEEKKTLILCLRKKEKNGSGHNELHDINTIMFVVIHELAHMMNDMWGHKQDFWMLFKFMLMNAVEAKIYTPIDYSRSPIVYCGLMLTYNPLFDPNV